MHVWAKYQNCILCPNHGSVNSLFCGQKLTEEFIKYIFSRHLSDSDQKLPSHSGISSYLYQLLTRQSRLKLDEITSKIEIDISTKNLLPIELGDGDMRPRFATYLLCTSTQSFLFNVSRGNTQTSTKTAYNKTFLRCNET